MPTQIESSPGIGEKIGMVGLVIPLGLLFIAMSQPMWRGEEMKQDFVADCNKRSGVLLIHKKMLGTSYKCASRLDT